MKLNMTYVRVAWYFISPMLGALPGIDVDMDAGTILIDIDLALGGITAAAASSGWAFAKWGKK